MPHQLHSNPRPLELPLLLHRRRRRRRRRAPLLRAHLQAGVVVYTAVHAHPPERPGGAQVRQGRDEATIWHTGEAAARRANMDWHPARWP